MAERTPNLNLPYQLVAQRDPRIAHNEVLRFLDSMVGGAVVDRDLATPPGSPTDGQRYIIASSPTGAWSGQAKKVAVWFADEWFFYTPIEGWRLWVADENVAVVYDGTNWVTDASTMSGVYQPLDSDLTAIAALTTASYGRSLLTLANAAALAAEVDPYFLTPTEGNAAYQPLDSDLTAIAALSTTTFGRSLLALANAAALRAAAELATTTTDNAITRYDGTGGKTQNSGVIVDDSDNILNVTRMSVGHSGAPSRHIHISAGSTNGIRCERTDGVTGYGELISSAANALQLTQSAASSNSIIDLQPLPLDGTSNAQFRFFRVTNTTGAAVVEVLKGNNTTTINHRLAGNGSSYVVADIGDFGIGTNSPAVKCDINSNSVRVRTSRSPASGAAGNAGEIAWDANYIYVCTASGAWKRAALTGGY